MTVAEKRRWYDQDPLISDAMVTLKHAGNSEQIRLALHIIKILSEHKLEQETSSCAHENPNRAVYKDSSGSSRWYDLDKTLKTSIEMLRCCDLPTQKLIANELVEMMQEYPGNN